jgi:hypothetical protein
MRWSLILSQYNFFILYLLSKQNERADALSRQKQNVSMNLSDDRVQHCTTQIIHSEMMSKPIQTASMTVADISVSVLVQDQNLFSEIQILNRCEWMLKQKMSHMMSFVRQFRTTRSFSTVLKVRMFITKCFWAWRKVALWERHWVLISESLCTRLIQYTHDLTMTEHKKRNVTDVFYWDSSFDSNVTECLYILQKLWQMLYEQQLKELSTRLLKAFICTEENLTKDIHWLCSESAVKWELYKSSDDYKLSQQESNTEIMQRDDCRMSDSDIHTTFLLSSWAFYHNSLRLRNSVCEQSVKKNLSVIEDCIKNVHSYHSETDEVTECMNQNVELTFVCSLTTVKTTEQICFSWLSSS